MQPFTLEEQNSTTFSSMGLLILEKHLLSPLKCIYRAFCNPATGTFAWVGEEQAEIIMLNDFQWNPSAIPWADLLQMLEGDIVHLPEPKNFGSQDIEFTKDMPFFATADAPLILVKNKSIDQANTQMLSVRWRFFPFQETNSRDRSTAYQPMPEMFRQTYSGQRTKGVFIMANNLDRKAPHIARHLITHNALIVTFFHGA